MAKKKATKKKPNAVTLRFITERRDVYHKNGDMTTTCCVCMRRKRDKEWLWERRPIGLDSVAHACSECAAAAMERAAARALLHHVTGNGHYCTEEDSE